MTHIRIFFNITAVIMAFIIITHDPVFSIDAGREVVMNDTLAAFSRFSFPSVRWKDDGSGFDVTDPAEGYPAVYTSRRGFRKDAVFMYVNLLVGGFLKELERLRLSGVTDRGVDKYLESFKNALMEKGVKYPGTFEDFIFSEMAWDGERLILPVSFQHTSPGSVQKILYSVPLEYSIVASGPFASDMYVSYQETLEGSGQKKIILDKHRTLLIDSPANIFYPESEEVLNIVSSMLGDFELALDKVKEYLEPRGFGFHAVRMVWRVLREYRDGISVEPDKWASHISDIKFKVKRALREDIFWNVYLDLLGKRSNGVGKKDIQENIASIAGRREVEYVIGQLTRRGVISVHVTAGGEIINANFEALAREAFERQGIAPEEVVRRLSYGGDYDPKSIFIREMRDDLSIGSMDTFFGRKYRFRGPHRPDAVYEEVKDFIKRRESHGETPEQLNILTIASAWGIQGYDVLMAAADAIDETGTPVVKRLVISDAQWVSVDKAKAGEYAELEVRDMAREGVPGEEIERRIKKFFKPGTREGMLRFLGVDEIKQRWGIDLVFEKVDILDPGDTERVSRNLKYDLVVDVNTHYTPFNDLYSEYNDDSIDWKQSELRHLEGLIRMLSDRGYVLTGSVGFVPKLSVSGAYGMVGRSFTEKVPEEKLYHIGFAQTFYHLLYGLKEKGPDEISRGLISVSRELDFDIAFDDAISVLILSGIIEDEIQPAVFADLLHGFMFARENPTEQETALKIRSGDPWALIETREILTETSRNKIEGFFAANRAVLEREISEDGTSGRASKFMDIIRKPYSGEDADRQIESKIEAVKRLAELGKASYTAIPQIAGLIGSTPSLLGIAAVEALFDVDPTGEKVFPFIIRDALTRIEEGSDESDFLIKSMAEAGCRYPGMMFVYFEVINGTHDVLDNLGDTSIEKAGKLMAAVLGKIYQENTGERGRIKRILRTISSREGSLTALAARKELFNIEHGVDAREDDEILLRAIELERILNEKHLQELVVFFFQDIPGNNNLISDFKHGKRISEFMEKVEEIKNILPVTIRSECLEGPYKAYSKTLIQVILGELLKYTYDAIASRYDPMWEHYSPFPGLRGEIKLSIALTPERKLVIRVSDNGLGKRSADSEWKRSRVKDRDSFQYLGGSESGLRIIHNLIGAIKTDESLGAAGFEIVKSRNDGDWTIAEVTIPLEALNIEDTILEEGGALKTDPGSVHTEDQRDPEVNDKDAPVYDNKSLRGPVKTEALSDSMMSAKARLEVLEKYISSLRSEIEDVRRGIRDLRTRLREYSEEYGVDPRLLSDMTETTDPYSVLERRGYPAVKGEALYQMMTSCRILRGLLEDEKKYMKKIRESRIRATGERGLISELTRKINVIKAVNKIEHPALLETLDILARYEMGQVVGEKGPDGRYMLSFDRGKKGSKKINEWLRQRRTVLDESHLEIIYGVFAAEFKDVDGKTITRISPVNPYPGDTHQAWDRLMWLMRRSSIYPDEDIRNIIAFKIRNALGEKHVQERSTAVETGNEDLTASDFRDGLTIWAVNAMNRGENVMLAVDERLFQRLEGGDPIVPGDAYDRLKVLARSLRSSGIDNVIIKRGRGENLAREIFEYASDPVNKTPFANIIVVGPESILEPSRVDKINLFDELKDKYGDSSARSFLSGIATRFGGREGRVETRGVTVDIVRVFLRSLELMKGGLHDILTDEYLKIDPDQDGRERVFRFTPVKAYDTEMLRRIRELQDRAFRKMA